ncbi:hypothetical protein VNI00_012200 [Paramarasmius palmivorus]|uniref:Protein-S-isoprenylcysteine O-methyltransferase n=1 Tax=Paramarasmius palmivorus TaxID=297713 RepID=A0AAW0C6P8_9AGAR
MSLVRASLTIAQAIVHHHAMTAPNPTRDKTRYHTEEWWVLQIAPHVFRMHSIVLWTCSVVETLSYLCTVYPTILPISANVVCPTGDSDMQVLVPSPTFLTGCLVLFMGAYIRIDCFKTLGRLFTFDLTLHEDHELVQTGFYSYVRHPAYTGSMLLVAGITFSHFTSGSWLTQCGPLRSKSITLLVVATWWTWALAVGISRGRAEDAQMKKTFGLEWERYAANVPWWFFPGIA